MIIYASSFTLLYVELFSMLLDMNLFIFTLLYITSHYMYSQYLCLHCLYLGTQLGRKDSVLLRLPTIEEPWWVRMFSKINRIYILHQKLLLRISTKVGIFCNILKFWYTMVYVDMFFFILGLVMWLEMNLLISLNFSYSKMA